MLAFTAADLKPLNGSNGEPIYISVKGVVYDCSSAPQFYGPGAAYHVFAGKESTRSLAKMMISDEEANAGWDNLSPDTMEVLEEWITKFKCKYPVVGSFVPDADFAKRGLRLPS